MPFAKNFQLFRDVLCVVSEYADFLLLLQMVKFCIYRGLGICALVE